MLKRTLSFVLALTMLATCLFILPVSATEDSVFTYTKDAGYWYDRVVMDNETFLNRSYTFSGNSITYTYSDQTKKATMDVSSSSNYKKFLDLSDLALNTESNGQVEVYVTVQPTKYSEDQWFPSKSTSSYWCLYLDTWIDGTRVQGGADQWKGFTTRYTSSGANVYFPNNGSSNVLSWNDSLEIPVKLVITKNNGALTMKHYADFGNGWIDGGSYLTVSKDSGSLTGLGFRFGSNSKSGWIRYILSDAKVIEKAPQTVRLSDVSGESYNLSDKKDVKLDFVLPQGVTEASLKLGEEEVADLSGQTAGAYSGTLDLAKVAKTGTFPVVLSGKANGAEFSASTTITVERPQSGSFDKTILSDPVAGGEFTDTVIADTLDIFGENSLNAVNQTGVRTFTYATEQNPVATLEITGDTQNIANVTLSALSNDTVHRTVGNRIDLTYDVTVIGGNPTSDQYYGISVGPYLGYSSGDTHPTSSGWLLLTTRAGGLYVNGVKICDHDKESATGTTVSVKSEIEILSSTQVKCTMYYKVPGGTWQKGPSQTKTVTDTRFRTMKLLHWMNKHTEETACNITYQFSNASLVEKSSTAKITDLSDQAYTGNELVPVSVYLPANYKEAVLSIDGNDVAGFKDMAAGAYTATLSIAGLGKSGRMPMTLSGTTADGETFSVSTNFFVAAPAAGSLDEELFSDPVASSYYADKLAMDNAAALNRTVSGFTYAYDSTSQSATVHNGGAYQTKAKLFDFVSLRLNDVESGSLEINMNVEVKPGNGSEYPTGSSSGSAWAIFTLSPIINGTAVDKGIDRYNAATLAFVTAGYAGAETPLLSADRLAYTNSVPAAGNKVPLKILVTKDADGITWTQQVKFNDKWIAPNAANTTYTGTGDLTGMRLWVGQNATAASSFVSWGISDVSVVEKAATTAEIRDLSAGFYTQYDTVPVDFNLPTGYKDAMITVDGTPVAVYAAATGDNAGSWQSKLNLKELGKVGAVKIGLKGTMNGGGEFNKSTTINVKAATAGADAVDNTKAVLADNSGLSSNIAYTNQIWSGTDAYLTQYAIEVSADVDFRQIVPTIRFTGPRYTYGDGYNVYNIQNRFEFPKGQYKLKLVFINNNFNTKDGSSSPMNVTAYVDGVCLGTVQIASDNSYPLADRGGKISIVFGKPTGWVDETISVKNITLNKYSLVTVNSVAAVGDNAVSVTFDREMESTGISLAKADGTPIAATATVSGKTVTLTAESALPADVKVVFGAGAEEADYQFSGYTGNNTAALTRPGQAITVPFAISANNGAASVQASELKVWESGQNAIIKATVNAIEAGTAAKLVVAAYKNNGGIPKMVESQILDITATAAGVSDYAYNVQFDNSYDYFKVFLWNNFGGMESLYDSQKTN